MLADTPLPRGFVPLLRAWIHFSKGSRTVRYLPALPGRLRAMDARSDRVPPLQTIIFSSFPGRTKGCRQPGSYRLGAQIEMRIHSLLRVARHTSTRPQEWEYDVRVQLVSPFLRPLSSNGARVSPRAVGGNA